MRLLKLFPIIAMASIGSSAIDLNIREITCDQTNLSQEQCDTLQRLFKEEAQIDLPRVDVETFAEGVANATAFSIKGQGSDYSDNFDHMSISPSLGVAIVGEAKELEDNPQEAEGLGLGGSITIGANLRQLDASKLGPINLNKTDIFFSFLDYRLKKPLNEAEGDGRLRSLGLHGRYRFLGPEKYAKYDLLTWGGLHFHTGIEYALLDVEVSRDYAGKTFERGDLSGAFNGGNVALNLESETFSIPLEVSSFLRLGHFFTLYGGLGVDFVEGRSKIGVKANGSAGGGLNGNRDQFEAELDADRSVEGESDFASFRNFVGLQFNAPFSRAFVQVNRAFDSELVGASIGAKVLW